MNSSSSWSRNRGKKVNFSRIQLALFRSGFYFINGINVKVSIVLTMSLDLIYCVCMYFYTYDKEKCVRDWKMNQIILLLKVSICVVCHHNLKTSRLYGHVKTTNIRRISWFYFWSRYATFKQKNSTHSILFRLDDELIIIVFEKKIHVHVQDPNRSRNPDQRINFSFEK